MKKGLFAGADKLSRTDSVRTVIADVAGTFPPLGGF
jgi:hypothetical protein